MTFDNDLPLVVNDMAMICKCCKWQRLDRRAHSYLLCSQASDVSIFPSRYQAKSNYFRPVLKLYNRSDAEF